MTPNRGWQALRSQTRPEFEKRRVLSFFSQGRTDASTGSGPGLPGRRGRTVSSFLRMIVLGLGDPVCVIDGHGDFLASVE